MTLSAALAILAPAAAQTKLGEEPVQHQIERAKIFREAYPLISEADFYCSIYIHEGDLPELRISGAEKAGEKVLLTDSDQFFINKGAKYGLEVGQVFLIVEVGQGIGGFGRLVTKHGRGQVVFLEADRAVAKVEKSCGQVMVGNFLLPFEEKETMLGKDLGYEPYAKGEGGAIGNIIYTQAEYNQIGSGGWAIIDIGAEAGIMVGQQMNIFRQQKGDSPREVVGNLVVIDTQPRTATVKVLSCNDPVRKGLLVQAK
jgi:hypothetical protein